MANQPILPATKRFSLSMPEVASEQQWCMPLWSLCRESQPKQPRFIYQVAREAVLVEEWLVKVPVFDGHHPRWRRFAVSEPALRE